MQVLFRPPVTFGSIILYLYILTIMCRIAGNFRVKINIRGTVL